MNNTPEPSTDRVGSYYLEQLKANLALAKQNRDPILWAESVWCIDGNPMRPYRLAGYEFLEEIILGPGERKVIQASSGCGKTELFIPAALAMADWGETVIYAFENDLKTSNIVKQRVDPNMKRSPYLKAKARDQTDNVRLKKVGDGTVFFLGAESKSSTTSYHSRIAFRDEYDKMNKEVAAGIAERNDIGMSQLLIDISNPSIPGYGINKAFTEGDQRHWIVPCSRCSFKGALDYDTHVKDDGRMECPKCGKPWKPGEPIGWVPQEKDGAYPSYWITDLMTPNAKPAEVMKNLNSPDKFVVQMATNMRKGKPYHDAEVGLSPADIAEAVIDRAPTQTADGGLITIDPGGVFDYQIYKKIKPDGRLVLTWCGIASGFDELDRIVEESGVAFGRIDYGPELDGAFRFCQRWQDRGLDFKRIAYRHVDDMATAWTLDAKDWLLVNCNRTVMADAVVASVRRKEFIFPAKYAKDPNSRLVKQMTAPKRILEMDTKGRVRVRWEHDETDPDHQFHCALYAHVWRLEANQGQPGSASSVSAGGY